MNTLYLDPSSWDLVLDASGNIALATEPYSLAQDAASNIKTFLGEVYYDTTLGVPYFQSILGQALALPQLKAQLVAQALLVPDVASAQVFISSFKNRVLAGQVQITSTSGQTAALNFGVVLSQTAATSSMTLPVLDSTFILDQSTLG